MKSSTAVAMALALAAFGMSGGPALADGGPIPEPMPEPAPAPEPAPEPEVAPAPGPASYIQLRGGYARSISEFPFAAEFEGGDSVFTTDYGDGVFAEMDIYWANIFSPNFGLELGVDAAVLENDDSVGEEVIDGTEGTCLTRTVLGLISDCHQEVTLTTKTSVVTADLLGKYDATLGQIGMTFGLGATFQHISSTIHADHLFPRIEGRGFESFVDRDTHFNGLGVKGGIEKSYGLGNTALSLNGEVYGSYVWGGRNVDINDFRTENESFFEEEQARFEDNISVATVDAVLSLSYQPSWLREGSYLEIGGLYRHMWSPMFTSNVHSSGQYDEGSIGDDEDDLSYWAVFFGARFSN